MNPITQCKQRVLHAMCFQVDLSGCNPGTFRFSSTPQIWHRIAQFGFHLKYVVKLFA